LIVKIKHLFIPDKKPVHFMDGLSFVFEVDRVDRVNRVDKGRTF